MGKARRLAGVWEHNRGVRKKYSHIGKNKPTPPKKKASQKAPEAPPEGS
jgi:hypothetical protein